MKITNFAPLVLSHLECDLHQTLSVSMVYISGVSVNFAKIHKTVFGISCLQTVKNWSQRHI